MKHNKTLSSTTDSRTYRILRTIDQDPYPYECWGTHGPRTRKSVPGSKSYCSWKRREIFNFEYRMYRTWKHNRKKQWKNQKDVNFVDLLQTT